MDQVNFVETAFKKFQVIWSALSSTYFTWSILEYRDPYFVLSY